MSQFDQLDGNLKKMYDSALSELKEMDAKRIRVLNVIKTLEPLFGKKNYSLETLKATSSVSHRKAAKAAAAPAKKGPKAAKAAKAAKAVKAAKPAKAAKAAKAVKAAKPAKAAKAAKVVKAAKPVVGKKPRIKEEEIRINVLKMLEACAPNSMSPVEIFGNLIKLGLPDTASFRTRVYGKLGVWAKEGLIRKVSRGVYQSAK